MCIVDLENWNPTWQVFKLGRIGRSTPKYEGFLRYMKRLVTAKAKTQSPPASDDERIIGRFDDYVEKIKLDKEEKKGNIKDKQDANAISRRNKKQVVKISRSSTRIQKKVLNKPKNSRKTNTPKIQKKLNELNESNQSNELNESKITKNTLKVKNVKNTIIKSEHT